MIRGLFRSVHIHSAIFFFGSLLWRWNSLINASLPSGGLCRTQIARGMGRKTEMFLKVMLA